MKTKKGARVLTLILHTLVLLVSSLQTSVRTIQFRLQFIFCSEVLIQLLRLQRSAWKELR